LPSGRDEFLALIESQVGVALRENRRVRPGWRGWQPVILAAGGRGMGKSAAIDRAADYYSNRAPRACLDIADRQYTEANVSQVPGDTALLRVLLELKWHLELPVKDNGQIHLPKLGVALPAIQAWKPGWRPGSGITRAEASQQLQREVFARIAHRESGDGWLADWIADVLSDIGAAAAAFPVDVFVRATVRAFVLKALGGRPHRNLVKWFERFTPNVPGDGFDKLLALAHDHSIPGDRRRRAERELVAMFLAELTDEYSGLTRMNRVAAPLVLLDDVTANPVGTRFLRLLLDARARPSARPDPLVVAGCVPPGFQLPPASAGTPAHGSEPAVRQVNLTKVDADDVAGMLDGADPYEIPAELAGLIVRLTGGLPLGADAMTRAVTLAAPQPPAGVTPATGAATPMRVASGRLLDIPVPDRDGVPGQPVAGYVLDRLIPDEALRATLILLSCARDRDEAQSLVDSHVPADPGRLMVATAEEALLANGWGSGGGYFVTDRFLRVLLLHQLRDPHVPVTSAQAHATLRDHHGGSSTGMLAGREPSRLFHCLALGDADHVALRLYESFAKSIAEDWLDALRFAAAAPGGHDLVHRETALGGRDTEPDPVHRSVNRLLHALWYASDPLVAPDQDVIGKVRAELHFLATQHPQGNWVFTRAARSWPDQLQAWKQADDLTI
jgi:hypothetical protein